MPTAPPGTREFLEEYLALIAPPPILGLQFGIDGVCAHLGCSQWRRYLPSSLTKSGAWFGPESTFSGQPMLTIPSSYADFVQETERQQQYISQDSFASLYEFAFQRSTTSLSQLTSKDALITLFVLVLLLRMVKAVLLPWFSSIGRKAGRRTHGLEWERQNETRIVKFGEYVFRLCFHSAISVIGIVYFKDSPWWKSNGTESLWRDWSAQDVEPGMIWYYLIQSAYNIDAMFSLLLISFTIQRTKSSWFPYTTYSIGWSKNVRGDFQEMFIHHVVTNLLIFGSSELQLQRVGSMVFLVHDISDVPVDLSKLANFLKWKLTTAFCFALMVVVWCVTRLGVLPFTIYWSIWRESWLGCTATRDQAILFQFFHPIFMILVGALIVLHMAWFAMFIQMGYVLVSKGEAHDLSEHKKGEEQLNGDTKKPKKL